MTVEVRPVTPVAEPQEKSVADVLRHAALIIEERGWCQGGYEMSGALCALGAIYTAYGVDEAEWGKKTEAERALNRIVGDADVALRPVPAFNDAEGRTAADVTAALRAAADALERAS